MESKINPTHIFLLTYTNTRKKILVYEIFFIIHHLEIKVEYITSKVINPCVSSLKPRQKNSLSLWFSTLMPGLGIFCPPRISYSIIIVIISFGIVVYFAKCAQAFIAPIAIYFYLFILVFS